MLGEGKRHGGAMGFFIQDRVHISSYLHSGSNQMTNLNAVKQKLVWA